MADRVGVAVVGLGVGEDAGDGIGAARAGLMSDDIYCVVGQVAQHEARRGDRLALRAPFGGEGLGEGDSRHQLRRAPLGADRATVERDAPDVAIGLDRNFTPEPLHSRGVRQRRASTAGATKVSIRPTAMKT